jgi:hypothetical protein
MDEKASPGQWVQVLSDMHGARHSNLSTAAPDHSKRHAIDLSHQMSNFFSVCEAAVSAASKNP